MSLGQSQKQVSWGTFILSFGLSSIVALFGGVGSYYGALTVFERRISILETKQDAYLVALNDLKSSIEKVKSSQESMGQVLAVHAQTLPKISSEIGEIKAALLTNRKVDELKMLMLGSGKRALVDQGLELLEKQVENHK